MPTEARRKREASQGELPDVHSRAVDFVPQNPGWKTALSDHDVVSAYRRWLFPASFFPEIMYAFPQCHQHYQEFTTYGAMVDAKQQSRRQILWIDTSLIDPGRLRVAVAVSWLRY